MARRLQPTKPPGEHGGSRGEEPHARLGAYDAAAIAIEDETEQHNPGTSIQEA